MVKCLCQSQTMLLYLELGPAASFGFFKFHQTEV